MRESVSTFLYRIFVYGIGGMALLYLIAPIVIALAMSTTLGEAWAQILGPGQIVSPISNARAAVVFVRFVMVFSQSSKEMISGPPASPAIQRRGPRFWPARPGGCGPLL